MTHSVWAGRRPRYPAGGGHTEPVLRVSAISDRGDGRLPGKSSRGVLVIQLLASRQMGYRKPNGPVADRFRFKGTPASGYRAHPLRHRERNTSSLCIATIRCTEESLHEDA